MTDITFQPFTDRLSRDIRNNLSASLTQVLHQHTLAPARRVADSYLRYHPEPAYTSYINTRLTKYGQVLSMLGPEADDPFFIACILWDSQLFFEVHEVLEPVWLKAEGEEKLFLQAMIRAAAVYIKMEYGYDEPAARLGAKALPILKRNRDRLAGYMNPDNLLIALQELHSMPPLLVNNRRTRESNHYL